VGDAFETSLPGGGREGCRALLKEGGGTFRGRKESFFEEGGWRGRKKVKSKGFSFGGEAKFSEDREPEKGGRRPLFHGAFRGEKGRRTLESKKERKRKIARYDD